MNIKLSFLAIVATVIFSTACHTVKNDPINISEQFVVALAKGNISEMQKLSIVAIGDEDKNRKILAQLVMNLNREKRHASQVDSIKAIDYYYNNDFTKAEVIVKVLFVDHTMQMVRCNVVKLYQHWYLKSVEVKNSNALNGCLKK